jgi:hypothetical protein
MVLNINEEGDYLILGGYPFTYLGTKLTEVDGGEFAYSDEYREGFKVCLRRDGVDYTFSLTEEEGTCSSGWTTASWGHWELNEESSVYRITLVPVKEELIKIGRSQVAQPDIECDLFFVSWDGGDSHYPAGGWGLKDFQWIKKNPPPSERQKYKVLGLYYSRSVEADKSYPKRLSPPEEAPLHVENASICLQGESGGLFTLVLYDDWLRAYERTQLTFGMWDLSPGGDLGLIEAVPREMTTIELPQESRYQKNINCPLFIVSYDGGCPDREKGFYAIRLEAWKANEPHEELYKDSFTDGLMGFDREKTYLLVGAREESYYKVESRTIYVYRRGETFYEVPHESSGEGIKEYNHPRPFNMIPQEGSSYFEELESSPPVSFSPTVRHSSTPMVHLIYGPSGLGKSTLFMESGKSVYETDAYEELTEECLICSIIVIGNKGKLTPEDVMDYFASYSLHPKFILVGFRGVPE